MDPKELIDTYIQLGAGASCILLVIWLVFYLLKRMTPKLQKIEMDLESTKEIMRQSNGAMERSADVMQSACSMMAEYQKIIEGNQKGMEDYQRVIENNTEAIRNFSVTLQEFSGFINMQSERLRDIDRNVEAVSRDTIKISERLNR